MCIEDGSGGCAACRVGLLTLGCVCCVCASPMQVVEALQQAGVRCRINVLLDGPVAVDVALVQPKVGAAASGLTISLINTNDEP